MKAVGAVIADYVASPILDRSDVLTGLALNDASRRSGARDREKLAPGDTHPADFTPECGRPAAGGVSSDSVISLDPLWLFLSLIPGGIGFVLFVYGRKQQRWPQLIAGLAFMAYPYFTPTTSSLVGVGAVLGAGLWAAVRMGY